jgi:hypothetical protein
VFYSCLESICDVSSLSVQQIVPRLVEQNNKTAVPKEQRKGFFAVTDTKLDAGISLQ